MVTTTTQANPEFIKELFSTITNAFDDGMKQSAHILWDVLLSLLIKHWLYVVSFIFVVLIIATIKAMFGRWGSLGSVLYNLFYFGALFIIGLIWGPEIFIDNFFNAIYTVILYKLCYHLVGLILDKVKRHQFKI